MRRPGSARGWPGRSRQVDQRQRADEDRRDDQRVSEPAGHSVVQQSAQPAEEPGGELPQHGQRRAHGDEHRHDHQQRHVLYRANPEQHARVAADRAGSHDQQRADAPGEKGAQPRAGPRRAPVAQPVCPDQVGGRHGNLEHGGNVECPAGESTPEGQRRGPGVPGGHGLGKHRSSLHPGALATPAGPAPTLSQGSEKRGDPPSPRAQREGDHSIITAEPGENRIR